MPISEVLRMKLYSRRAKQDTRDSALNLVFILHGLQPECLVNVVQLAAMEIRDGHPMRYLTTDSNLLPATIVRDGHFKPPMSEIDARQLKRYHQSDVRYLMNHQQSVLLIQCAFAQMFPAAVSTTIFEALTNNGVLQLYVCDMERKKTNS